MLPSFLLPTHRRITSLFLMCLPLWSTGCIGYLLQASYFQVELLASRRPIDRVLEEGRASAGQEQRLRLIPEIKAYGAGLGLSATDNYGTVAWGWERSLWNVSACDPLSFTPKTWSFPIVGTVPYLGYFRQKDVDRWQKTVVGLDVWVRTAGAWSTLGWFRDPVLPGMLLWDEGDLAETVFHELAHATRWVPGSVDFNESCASFVGEAAGDRYLSDRYGADSRIAVEARTLNADWRGFQLLLKGVYEDLDRVYQDPALSPEQKLARKTELFAGLPERVQASQLVMKDRWEAATRRGVWNNARLVQYRNYSSEYDRFAALLAKNNGDIPAFIQSIQQITKGRKDPFAALAEVVDVPGVKNP